MSQDQAVTRLYEEFNSLVAYLSEKGEASFCNTVDEHFRKSLLLSAASYFEHRITQDIREFISEVSNENELLIAFAEKKAIKRQYHQYFAWDEANANQFFGLFGTGFSTYMKKMLKDDDKLSDSMKAFIEIGRDRNRLVHNDFATFPLEKTSEEIYLLYKKALIFVELVPKQLRQYLSKKSNEEEVKG